MGNGVYRRYVLFAAVLCGSAGAAGFGALAFGLSNQDRVVPIPVQRPQRGSGGELREVDKLMEAKLERSEQILRGLVTHDFAAIREAAESLKLMSLDVPKGIIGKPGDAEVYEHFRTEFMRLAARLEEEATGERLSGAAWFQQQLTATCVSCHEYIRDEGRSGGR